MNAASCCGAGSGQQWLADGFDEVLLQLSKAVDSAACCKGMHDVRREAHNIRCSPAWSVTSPCCRQLIVLSSCYSRGARFHTSHQHQT
ncbi:TPA: hypothetical protein ACH3X2_007581 [Trebouxia sp. C0005]